MSFTSYLTQQSDLNNKNISSFIVSCRELGRFSKTSKEDVGELLNACRELRPDCSVFFEWDVLQTEADFNSKLEILSSFDLSKFDAIRVCDMGAFNWVLENTSHKIHLLLENGHHNLKGIKAWENLAGDRLERIILGLELPQELVKKYTNELKTPTEIQVLGHLLLFYSPRSLVKSTLEFDERSKKELWYEANANSEETPHKGFQLVENSHGSFMFHPRKHSLLDVLSEVRECGIKFFRLDLRLFPESLSDSCFQKGTFEEFQKAHSFIRGYFKANKSDRIFVKLKNYRLVKKDDLFLGTIVDVKKDQYMALKVEGKNKSLKIGQKIQLKTPDGKEKYMPVRSIKDISLKDISQVNQEKIILIPHMSGISVKTRVNYTEAHV